MSRVMVVVERAEIYGSSSIGVFIFANNEVALIPLDAPAKVEEAVREALGVEVLRASVMSSVLLGVLVAGNSNGLLLPAHTLESEMSKLRGALGDINLTVLPSKKNAIGNLVLANDRAAVVDPDMDRGLVRAVEDALGVEVVRMRIAGHSLVGAVAAASNSGVLVHPLASDEEVEVLADVFKARVDVGTVNRGSPFIRSGLVVNDKGALVGADTTGPELMRIHEVFFSG